MADLTVSGSIDSFMSLTDASAVRFVKFNADNTVSLRSDSDMRADLGLVIGTNVQAYDADLASWAGVTRGTGFDTAAAIAVNTAGGVLTHGGAGAHTTLNVSGTTSSSSSTTGTVTIGNGTAATNVGIGAGIINAGASVNITQGNGSASSGLRWNASNHLAIVHNSTDRAVITSTGVVIGSGMAFGFTSGTTPTTATLDASISRIAPGVVGVPSLTASGTITAASAVATPAGGSTSARLLFGTTAGFGIYYGSGAPTVSAAQGSIYIRSDGSSSSTRLYVNTDGATTWTNFTSAT